LSSLLLFEDVPLLGDDLKFLVQGLSALQLEVPLGLDYLPLIDAQLNNQQYQHPIQVSSSSTHLLN